MREVYVENSTVNLFIDSLCEIMRIEPQKIIESQGGSRFVDFQTNVFVTIDSSGKKEKWVLHVPGSKSFILGENEIKKLSKGINERENALLLAKHKELYDGENVYKLFVEIQDLRKTSEMVEEAWQNLLTVYALNMDGDESVSRTVNK